MNNNKQHRKKNQYPLPKRTVVYNHKKNLQPIPEVGKKYHCFDDGKITYSRHFIIRVNEVLGHQQFRKKYPKEFKLYREAVKDHYWIYSTHSDKFIITYKGENNEFGVYVRTKQGDWFGIGNWWNCGVLDVTGKLWNNFIDNLDNYDYTEKEKEDIKNESIL